MGGEGEGKIVRGGLGWLTPFFLSFCVCSALVWDGVGGAYGVFFFGFVAVKGVGVEANDYVF